MAVGNSIDGIGNLFRGLREFAEGAADLRRSEREIARVFGEVERDWLSSEGRGSFARLTPDYARRKAATHPGRPILQRSGGMFRGLTERVAVESNLTGTEMRVRAGNARAARLAAIHARGFRTLRARNPLAPPEAFARPLAEVIEKQAVTFAVAHGFRVK